MIPTSRTGARTVAHGGGHGLAATLRALRDATDDITAVVGVADDGGSSGRLRREFGVIPPGDLRMALAALCRDDEHGRLWARVVQHRFAGDGALAGHALGNLLIAGLWEHTDDIVAGLDAVAHLLGAHGRVLPLARAPLDIVAEVRGLDPATPEKVSTVRGQAAIAKTPGRVLNVRMEPADVAVCHEALEAVAQADAILMGPGSWYTSVLPHLMLPEMRRTIEQSPARRICILNLEPQPGETSEFHLHTHLDVLHAFAPDLRFDVVLADRSMNTEPDELARSAARLGATLEVCDLADPHAPGTHSTELLTAALRRLLPSRRHNPMAG